MKFKQINDARCESFIVGGGYSFNHRIQLLLLNWEVYALWLLSDELLGELDVVQQSFDDLETFICDLNKSIYKKNQPVLNT